MTYEYEQYLAHHGIKGQKWGNRKYQNEDGSLTEEGKLRYRKLFDKYDRRIEKNQRKIDKYKAMNESVDRQRNDIERRALFEANTNGRARKSHANVYNTLTSLSSMNNMTIYSSEKKIEKYKKKKEKLIGRLGGRALSSLK